MIHKHCCTALLGIALAPLLLTACSKTLDTSAIEESITADLKKNGLPVRSVACPAQLPSQVGQSFDCVGALNPEGGFFITVAQEDEQGEVSWKVPNSWRLLNLSDLESEFQKTLQTQTRQPIKVECGNSYRPTKPGDSFACQVTGQTRQTATILVKVEPQGKLTWQEVRQVAVKPSPGAAVTPSAAAAANPIAAPPVPQVANPPANPDATIGVRDATGWVQLAD